MKKNLLAVIILALVLVNLILTAVLVFSIIPQTKKSNELIDQVCAAINIELEGGQNKDSSAVPIEEIAVYNITDNFTVNLADNGDGKKHYAVFSVGLSVNKTSEEKLDEMKEKCRELHRPDSAEKIFRLAQKLCNDFKGENDK